MAEARLLSTPILVDTLPVFVEAIAEAVGRSEPQNSAKVYNTVAEEHGGERARITNYKHEDLIREYQILRWILLEVLEEAGVTMTVKERIALHSSIDVAVRQAATTFTLVHERIRDQYVATLSHDMKNPLSSILLNAELLVRKSVDPDFVVKQAGKLKEAAGRMQKMIDDLLDLSLINANGSRLKLELEPLDISALTEEIICDLSGRAQGRLKASVEKITGTWDRTYLRRALENLMSNALKYADPRSEICIHGTSTKGRLLWSIHNSGTPIPPEEQETIFQVFIRAKESSRNESKGWGLGLPLVRAVAEAHGGSLGLESSAESGTTFFFDIPLDSAPYQEAPTIELM